jgi:hypothetical protein
MGRTCSTCGRVTKCVGYNVLVRETEGKRNLGALGLDVRQHQY